MEDLALSAPLCRPRLLVAVLWGSLLSPLHGVVQGCDWTYMGASVPSFRSFLGLGPPQCPAAGVGRVQCRLCLGCSLLFLCSIKPLVLFSAAFGLPLDGRVCSAHVHVPFLFSCCVCCATGTA